jgi:hypothetical protein
MDRGIRVSRRVDDADHLLDEDDAAPAHGGPDQTTYDEVRQMYYQNPKFGFFFLELVAERLMRDAQRTSPAWRSATPQRP